MNESQIAVTRSSMPTLEEYVELIEPLWESRWLTNMGILHSRFEEMLGQYLGVPMISLFANGHLALELALQAFNLSGEVITTPFTFASTTHAIVRNGLQPVFCDIRLDDFTIDPSKIEALITDRTSAIVPVHVYGNPCAVFEIERIASKYGLKVIYDAAHAFGVRFAGRAIGTFGDASMFSFHATKVFNSVEGGGVSFADPRIREILYRLKNFGIASEELVDGIGSNAKMSEFHAAMGICNLRHVDEEIAKRRDVHERYESRLGGVSGLRMMLPGDGVDWNFSYCPVLFDETEFGSSRNEIYARLRNAGVHPRKYFYPLTNTFASYRGRFDVDLTPIARHVAKRVLTLPLYPDLDLNDVDRICDCILE